MNAYMYVRRDMSTCACSVRVTEVSSNSARLQITLFDGCEKLDAILTPKGTSINGLQSIGQHSFAHNTVTHVFAPC